MNIDLAIRLFENPDLIGTRVPQLEERLALDALQYVAIGEPAPGWTRREPGWEDPDPCPVALRGRIPPMPLEWFDRPECHRRYPPNFDDFDLGWIAVKRLAGHGAQPVARDLGAALTTRAPTAAQKSILRSVFEGAVPRELGALAENAGASIHDIARAMHLCHAQHATAVDWINQWAAPPRPQTEIFLDDGTARNPAIDPYSSP